ncbi:discoidin domain-containing protein [Cellvibrio sp. UBA7661]|uniref:discoidin domain-containing protein n=1 Tax=Cellvibrio sp. UBA7661 TaxID=1946311 RepID=UPI002F3547FA
MKNVFFRRLFKISILFLSSLVSTVSVNAQSTCNAFVGNLCTEINAMYVKLGATTRIAGVLGNTTAENAMLKYAVRVISYDTNNPTSFTSTAASLTIGSNCGGSAANRALNKPVTASSFIAAGYEPFRIVDGNTTSSRWASAYSGAQWIQVDLGT